MPLIDVQGLTVRYGAPARTILQSVDLTVEEGDFVCVLGQTGCGKSTLLRLILGAEQPAEGRILIDGVMHPRPDRARGYVPQKYALFPDRTVLDNITFGLEVCEFNLFTRWTPRYFAQRRQYRREALEYLKKLGLREADAAKYPDELSGGMQQRVAIAQALINRPRILLMDEAFSALDPATRRETQGLMRQLWKDNGFTALFVTHNTREALLLGSRVIVLAKDDADAPSRVVLDEKVPGNWREHEADWVLRLEKASLGEGLGDALVHTSSEEPSRAAV